ncbi:hypothetical protein P3X46_011263 [Hevea brasiliensis]|uniref:Uncharacterized protein n=1 Tax=Hevea brasiliensis TaxID=3981 RepID=A0ABQ9MGM5_HEVBR|nr:hypothetical protein P3X46_011263 [Hevea brasiliensis]
MKAYSTALAALALLLSIFLSGWLNQAQAEGLPVPQASSTSASSMASTSQTFPVAEKNPFKQVDSSFRKIPPSTSNPTQNNANTKCKSPLED